MQTASVPSGILSRRVALPDPPFLFAKTTLTELGVFTLLITGTS